MKMGKTGYIAALVLALYASTGWGQVYTKFGPANGVLKGSTATYQTSAALSADIRGLWSGTCNSTTFLRGDGACAAAGAGTVTSVALTMPTGFAVSGSPITSNGTLAVTTALSGVLKGNGSGFTTSLAADIIGLWTGTCNSATFLRGDGACITPASGGSPGGLTTQVQFNNAGAFGGDAGLTWDNTGKVLTATNIAGSGTSLTALNGTNIASGTVADARLSANIPLLNGSPTFAGNLAAATLTGSGAGVTNLNGTNIASGTVADARLSANVPLLNANNTFTASIQVIKTAGTNAQLEFANNVGELSDVCVANASGICTVSDAAGELSIRSPSIHFGTLGGAVYGTVNSSGFTTNNINATANLQQGGVNACLSNGTNCPAGGLTQTSGSVTLTTNLGCTVNQTMTVFWVKTGKNVTINWTGFSCTSNTTGGAQAVTLPSTIFPTTQASSNGTVNDAGVGKAAIFSVTSAGAWVLLSNGTAFSGAGLLSVSRGSMSYTTDT